VGASFEGRWLGRTFGSSDQFNAREIRHSTIASGVTNKPAFEGHFGSGQWNFGESIVLWSFWPCEISAYAFPIALAL
jgi:hypothetical protein